MGPFLRGPTLQGSKETLPRQEARGCEGAGGGAAKEQEGALPETKGAALRGTHLRPLTTPGRPQHPQRPAQSFVLRSPT